MLVWICWFLRYGAQELGQCGTIQLRSRILPYGAWWESIGTIFLPFDVTLRWDFPEGVCHEFLLVRKQRDFPADSPTDAIIASKQWCLCLCRAWWLATVRNNARVRFCAKLEKAATKGKCVPVQAKPGPEVSRRLRLQGFSDSRHMEMARLSALRSTAGKIPGTHLC